MELENLNQQVVFKGDKSEVVNFLNSNGYRIDQDTPSIIVATLIKDSYSLYIRN